MFCGRHWGCWLLWRSTSDGSPIMGSGSFLGRKTLVQIPDVFLTSLQFLHRAFLVRIKSINGKRPNGNIKPNLPYEIHEVVDNMEFSKMYM